jgi:hypothetical protein
VGNELGLLANLAMKAANPLYRHVVVRPRPFLEQVNYVNEVWEWEQPPCQNYYYQLAMGNDGTEAKPNDVSKRPAVYVKFSMHARLSLLLVPHLPHVRTHSKEAKVVASTNWVTQKGAVVAP